MPPEQVGYYTSLCSVARYQLWICFAMCAILLYVKNRSNVFKMHMGT